MSLSTLVFERQTGRSWQTIKAPSVDADGSKVSCDTLDTDKCSLHFHSVTTPHNLGRIFSSPAPGFVMGVGSIGAFLKPYDECDTFLSTDAGVTWKMAKKEAHKYEFGDQGSIIVAVNDEEGVDVIDYTNDMGKSWCVIINIYQCHPDLGVGNHSIMDSNCGLVLL